MSPSAWAAHRPSTCPRHRQTRSPSTSPPEALPRIRPIWIRSNTIPGSGILALAGDPNASISTDAYRGKAMSTIGIHRIVNGVLTSADTATLAVTNQAGVTVVPTVVVPPSAPGVYSYVAPPLTPGNYTAIWTFTVAGSTEDVVRRIFQVESATAALDGISLSQI